MMSRIFVVLGIGAFLGMQWGCNAIIEEGELQKSIVLPVAPSQCQALYHIPVEAKGASAELLFPKGTSVAELPGDIDGASGASCTLVVIRESESKRRVFWKIRTADPGFTGRIRCATESDLSPVFDIKAQRSPTSKLYVYASVEEQERVESLLQAGKTTATWHKGENDNSDLYEQNRDGALQRKKGMPLYKACPLD